MSRWVASEDGNCLVNKSSPLLSIKGSQESQLVACSIFHFEASNLQTRLYHARARSDMAKVQTDLAEAYANRSTGLTSLHMIHI